MGLWYRASRAALAAVGGIVLVGCAAKGEPLVGTATRAPSVSLAPAPASGGPSITASASQTRVAAHPGAAATLDDLRVMSFNCRVSTLFDLHNTWGVRKGLLVETIRNFDPDLLGTQECLAAQSDYLRERLSEYGFVGAGRNNGQRRGEMCGVFFRKDRFELLESGHFWLSERPSKPGSKGWGAVFPRMVTWVKLRPRDGSSPAFYWFNTHLDAFSSRARLNGAKLLRSRIASIAGSTPVLITGDFNADAGSDPYRILVGGSRQMTDTFRVVNSDLHDGNGTRHGFLGGRGGPRIDWILASGEFRAIDADIDHTRGGLGYPSDHFPVTAVLRPRAHSVMAQVE